MLQLHSKKVWVCLGRRDRRWWNRKIIFHVASSCRQISLNMRNSLKKGLGLKFIFPKRIFVKSLLIIWLLIGIFSSIIYYFHSNLPYRPKRPWNFCRNEVTPVYLKLLGPFPFHQPSLLSVCCFAVSFSIAIRAPSKRHAPVVWWPYLAPRWFDQLFSTKVRISLNWLQLVHLLILSKKLPQSHLSTHRRLHIHTPSFDTSSFEKSPIKTIRRLQDNSGWRQCIWRTRSPERWRLDRRRRENRQRRWLDHWWPQIGFG